MVMFCDCFENMSKYNLRNLSQVKVTPSVLRHRAERREKLQKIEPLV